MFDKERTQRFLISIVKEIRAFLLSESCREALVFLFFVCVSLGFWLLNTLDDVYKTEFRVPVRLKDVPKEVVLTTDFPENVQVSVEDRGTVLLNYMLGRTFYPIAFDFKDYSMMGNHVRISSEELTKKIVSQLNTSTKLLAIRPDTLDFIYAQGEAKRLPVRLNGQVGAGRQYYVSSVTFSPDSVVAYAPREVLDTLTVSYTHRVQVEGLTDTLRQNVALGGRRGVKFIPSTTVMTACVDMYSEKTVEVPVVGISFPAGKVLRTFPSKVQVTFQVGLKRFMDVSANEFFIGVTYEDVLRNKDGKLPLTLKTAPDWVSHVRIAPASVEYLIEQQLPEEEAEE